MARSKSRSRKSLFGWIFSGVAALAAMLPPMVSESIRTRLYELLTNKVGGKAVTTSVPGLSAKLGEKLQEDQGSDCLLLGCKVRLEAGPMIRILNVPPGSNASRLGLVPNDWIESVDRHRVATLESLNVTLGRVGKFVPAEITVFRGTSKFIGSLKMSNDNTLRVVNGIEPAGAREFF